MRNSPMMAGLAVLVIGVLALAGAAYGWPTTVEGTCANSSGEDANGVAYWSGTVAYVKGHWRALSGIRKVELWVNEVKRYEREWTSGYPTIWPPQPGPAKTWRCEAFSTTQWVDGTELVLKAVCVPVTGQTQEVIWEKERYSRNVSYALWNVTLHRSAQLVAITADNVCSSCNHTADGAYGNHTKATIMDRLPHRQVFYIATHSNSAGFYDCVSNNDPAHWVSANDVSNALANRTVSDPHFNFVFVDGCNSAGNATLYNGFTRNGQALVQSYLGWNGIIPDDYTSSDWSQFFWNGLSQKKTVAQAIAYADAVAERHPPSVVWGTQGAAYRLHMTY